MLRRTSELELPYFRKLLETLFSRVRHLVALILLENLKHGMLSCDVSLITVIWANLCFWSMYCVLAALEWFSFLFSKSQAEPTWNRIYFLFRLCCIVCSMASLQVLSWAPGIEVEKPCGGPSMDWSWNSHSLPVPLDGIRRTTMRTWTHGLGFTTRRITFAAVRLLPGATRPCHGGRWMAGVQVLPCGGHFVWSGFSRWLYDPSHLRPCWM